MSPAPPPPAIVSDYSPTRSIRQRTASAVVDSPNRPFTPDYVSALEAHDQHWLQHRLSTLSSPFHHDPSEEPHQSHQKKTKRRGGTPVVAERRTSSHSTKRTSASPGTRPRPTSYAKSSSSKRLSTSDGSVVLSPTASSATLRDAHQRLSAEYYLKNVGDSNGKHKQSK